MSFKSLLDDISILKRWAAKRPMCDFILIKKDASSPCVICSASQLLRKRLDTLCDVPPFILGSLLVTLFKTSPGASPQHSLDSTTANNRALTNQTPAVGRKDPVKVKRVQFYFMITILGYAVVSFLKVFCNHAFSGEGVSETAPSPPKITSSIFLIRKHHEPVSYKLSYTITCSATHSVISHLNPFPVNWAKNGLRSLHIAAAEWCPSLSTAATCGYNPV